MTHSILNGPQWTWKVRMSASRHGLGTSHSKDKRATPSEQLHEKRLKSLARVSAFMSLFSDQLVIREDMQLSLCLVAMLSVRQPVSR